MDLSLTMGLHTTNYWLHIYDEIQHLQPGDAQITKVAAHQSQDLAASDFELWVVVNNLLADRAARLANLSRPPAFWQYYHHHVKVFMKNAECGSVIQRVILDISRQVVLRENCHNADGSITREHEEEAAQHPTESTGLWNAFMLLALCHGN